jgi:hypothetical protein
MATALTKADYQLKYRFMIKPVIILATVSFFGIFWFSKNQRKDELLMFVCLALFILFFLTITYKLIFYEQQLKRQGKIKKVALVKWFLNKEIV